MYVSVELERAKTRLNGMHRKLLKSYDRLLCARATRLIFVHELKVEMQLPTLALYLIVESNRKGES